MEKESFDCIPVGIRRRCAEGLQELRKGVTLLKRLPQAGP